MYHVSFLRLFCFVLLLLCGSKSYTQSEAEMKALNSYIQFLNESVHGLTVAHILFVNYNKDLNKYIDLDSHKINTHITNQELGASIFDNPDINTSDSNESAIQLADITKRKSAALPSSVANRLNSYVSDIKTILNSINSLRFEIENFLKSSDLNVKENVYKSYELLERVVSYFDKYASLHDQLARSVRGHLTYKYDPLDFVFFEIHSASISLIKEIRNDNTSKLDNYISRILGAVDNLETRDYELSNSQKLIAAELSRQVREMTRFLTNQQNGGAVPENFKLYGKSYYMHNHILLSSFNSISPGFVSKMNQILEKEAKALLTYDDRPVLYKLTYPQKMQEIEAVVTQKALPLSTSSPTPNDPFSPVIAAEPEQDYVILEFYDPDLIDRDSISVSFNDEWILENYMLQEEPKKIKLDIDPQKGNSVFIVAKNEGIIAPNTVGFKYRYNGKGKKKVMERNMEANLGYELILTIDGLGGFSDR